MDTCKYLGVVVSNDLRWNKHVLYCKTKATKTLNFIRRNLYSCNQEAKKLAYVSLVRPHLEYASAAWDVNTQANINTLESVQKRAARFIVRNYNWDASASQLVKELQLPTLSERRKHSRLVIFYKAVNGISPISLSHLSTSSRLTRSSSSGLCFNHLQPKTNCFKYSFFPRTVVDWNSLDPNIRNKLSVDSFKTSLDNLLSLRCIESNNIINYY